MVDMVGGCPKIAFSFGNMINIYIYIDIDK